MIFHTFLVYLQILLQNDGTNQCTAMLWLKHKWWGMAMINFHWLGSPGRVNLVVVISVSQWWANIIKWTRTNIRIYLHATLCTEWLSEYIWMQHIYRTNIQIYCIPEIAQIQIWIIFEVILYKYSNICTPHWLKEFF